MKTCANLFIVIAIFLSTTAYAQTIRRVNNTGIPLGTNMYSTLQAAHNAAANGDIIYIEGSGETYAGATITKRLTIIGPGYLLAENYPNFADVRPAEFTVFNDDIFFNAGSEGSILTGCSALDVRINVSNITITRNRSLRVFFDNLDAAPLTGIVITKNYDLSVSTFSSSASISVIISNNYINNTDLSSNFSGTFLNNIINGFLSLSNYTISNNIWYYGSSSGFTNCTFSNNIDARALVNSNAFGTTNGNQANVDKTTLFVGPTGNSTDGQWKLKAGSPAIGAGFGGIDCGMFGGLDPYALSGIVAAEYPTITSFTTSGAGNSTTPLTVKISTKSN
jgi:hypothetical protein